MKYNAVGIIYISLLCLHVTHQSCRMMHCELNSTIFGLFVSKFCDQNYPGKIDSSRACMHTAKCKVIYFMICYELDIKHNKLYSTT